ncbi:MAG: hypothetical protein D6715_14725 [Calditrichaeota bacterium]|nr:MAG: hypothetical protein D6715_14725 [Calditrichota bacterium]
MRWAWRLALITVLYNVLEGVVSVLAGRASGSVALVGFGLDSFVESLSGLVMLWRFFPRREAFDHAREMQRERRAVLLVGLSFLALSAYVGYESIHKLVFQEIPRPSVLGIAIAVVSLIAMPLLFYGKKRIALQLGSRSLQADARQTLACMFLSFALLLGLVLNYSVGFWQADPLVGLLIAFFLLREGVEAIRQRQLCQC